MNTITLVAAKAVLGAGVVFGLAAAPHGTAHSDTVVGYDAYTAEGRTATASSARTSPVRRVSMMGTGCVAQAMARVFRLVVTTRVVCWSTRGQ
jgi:hypothetical protein